MSADSTNYSHLYKYNEILNNQFDRRNKLLLELKKRRNDQVNELRGIADLFTANVSVEEPVDVVKYKKKRSKYGCKIMLSEWMTEVPSDLEDWIFKMSPVGVRNIIVAHSGVTIAYNRKNEVKAKFQSNLPGGRQNSQSHHFTLLDCIYRHNEKTYYVLDILVWNSYSLLNCSSEFRFFFLKSKLQENPDLLCSTNRFNFINIEYYPAELQNVENLLSNEYVVNSQELPVDGVLFYHKHCTYMSGLTPLVGWLKPFMIPEKLQIPIHTSYQLKRPTDYVSLEHHLENIQSKKKKGTKNKMNYESCTDEMEMEQLDESIDSSSSSMDMLG